MAARSIILPAKGVTGGAGLDNEGLLVKTWGTVTYVDPASTFFVMDDGSGVPNSSIERTGLRVDLTSSANPATVPPLAGYVLAVTGVSSCDTAGGVCYRVLRPRTQADISLYNPQDASGPTVSITMPSSGVLHVDLTGNDNTMVIAGAASAGTSIISVQVFIDSGASTPHQPGQTPSLRTLR